jgi:hypothetical protein
MTFVQIIEMTTTKAPEIEELMDGWMAATEGRRSASRSLLTKDRKRPDTYVQVVEFPSYEEAMANSALPETTAFAEKAVGPLLVRAHVPQSRSRSRRRAVANRIRRVLRAFSGRTGHGIPTRGVPNDPFGHSTSSHIADRTADQ